MSALPQTGRRMTPAEYLAFERESETKHEFWDGEIYAMSGARRAHNLVAGGTYVALYTQLRGKPCETYASDMKVKIPSTDSYAYPDVTVVCGEPRLEDEYGDVLLNPTLIIEVLSPSTERFDRGMKFQRYREIESLQEYLLIAQDSSRIERFLRQGVWQFNDVQGLDAVLDLPSIGCSLALADVYERIDLDAHENNETDAR